ncbi:MAG: glycosyltransferase [Chloroflexota bacterium]
MTPTCRLPERCLENCGGFDERFVYLEDQELSFRLAAAGQQMVFQPSAVVYHRHADTLWAYLRKKATIGYWKAQVVRRFPERLVRDSHTPQSMKIQMVLAAAILGSILALIVASLINWGAAITASGLAVIAAIVLFLLSTVPFCVKAWPKDRVVALVAPFLLFVRAIGLGIRTLWDPLATASAKIQQ